MEDIYKKYLKITSKNIIDIKDDRDIIEMLDFQKIFLIASLKHVNIILICWMSIDIIQEMICLSLLRNIVVY
ncbi:hypothetical protein [Ligilactobacillus animalis]